MPLRPKYRPNRHLEPLYDSHFSVMDVLQETPSETSPSPMEGRGAMSHTSPNVAEVLNPEVDQKIESETSEAPTEPSFENLPEDVLVYIQNLKEKNDSLENEIRASKEENGFKMQFCERLQVSNNECIDLILDLKNRVRYLETFGRSGRNTHAGEIRRCVLELGEKREECDQLREDLDRFDMALRDSRETIGRLESEVDFYKDQVGGLQNTIRQLEGNQNGTSVGKTSSFRLLETDSPKPTEVLVCYPYAPSVVEGSAGFSSPVKSTSPPEALGGSTPKPPVVSGSRVPTIPKLDLSEVGRVETELTEPLRTRESDSPVRPKAPNLATSWNGASSPDLVDPFSYKSKVIPLKKTKMAGIPRSSLPPVKVCPGGQIHQPRIVRGSDDNDHKSSAKRRAIILPTLNANQLSTQDMKAQKPSSCVLLPPLQKLPSLRLKKEHSATNKKRN